MVLEYNQVFVLLIYLKKYTFLIKIQCFAVQVPRTKYDLAYGRLDILILWCVLWLEFMHQACQEDDMG